MANKYCNLVGTNKIKDEYQKINAGFDKVETDVNAINGRVDNIVNNPDPNKDLEIVDARHSAVKDKTFTTLDARLEESEQEAKTHKADYASLIDNPTMHRNIFRGKNLGTSLTTEQKTNIQNGTFKDIYLGDYWYINGRIWRIVDINYWYNTGVTAFTNNHLVIMPDTPLYNAQMNETNTTEGGYAGSLMYTANLENAKSIINSAFGSAVLTHKEFLVNAVNNGRPSGGAWYDSSVELPSEIMMYGHLHFSPVSDGSVVPSIQTIDKTQLALFRVHPRFILARAHNQWLRDVVSATQFALIQDWGYALHLNAVQSFGVRPVFAIG